MDLKKSRKREKNSEAEKVAYKKAVGFHVYRSEDKHLPFREWKRLTAFPVTDKKFSDHTIEPGKIYFYKITDVDVYGFESPPYEPPRSYWADESGRRIEHNPLNDEVGYNVYRSTDRNLPLDQWERRNAKLLPTTGFNDEGIEKNVTYYYYVTAVSAAGLESPPSEIISVVGK